MNGRCVTLDKPNSTSKVQVELMRTLEVGDTVTWVDNTTMEVMGKDGDYIILADEQAQTYSICNLKRKVCGASDRVFDMFDYYTEEGVEEVLKHLTIEPKYEKVDEEGHEHLVRVDDQPDIFKMEVSYRNNAPICDCVNFEATFK